MDDTGPVAVLRVRREDGTDVDVNIGKSTLLQTIFNSSNTIVGVGMLALPLGVRYAGWVLGLGLLIAFAIFTRYTASILGKCMDVDRSIANFADIGQYIDRRNSEWSTKLPPAYVAFGEKGRVITSILFTLELSGACISLGKFTDGVIKHKNVELCFTLPKNVFVHGPKADVACRVDSDTVCRYNACSHTKT